MNLKRSRWWITTVIATCIIARIGFAVHAQNSAGTPDLEHDRSALLDAYRQVEVASVSDAMEQILHEKRYMSHRMQAIFPTKFVGTALTVQLVKEENHDPHALDGMLAAIDSGNKDDVYVMQVEDGQDIAGMGGLMGTAMHARGFAGAVIDGGVRDLPQLKRLGFPVYATGVVPSTSVGHYRVGATHAAVRCDGILVQPGDIVSADQDGVVVVPRARAVEVLERAQKLDYTEHAMYPVIEKLHSIVDAVRQFGRI